MNLIINDKSLSLTKGDITIQTTDAIVNAANPSLLGGGGVSGAILRAGGQVILEECKRIVEKQGRLPAGKAVITTGGNLKARNVIHTVGPIWHGGDENEAELLASSYRESLRLAEKQELQSISFPSISTGIYGYPLGEAAEVAVRTVVDFLRDEASSVQEVVFVLWDDRTLEAYQTVLSDLK